jgi:hypothetical protein
MEPYRHAHSTYTNVCSLCRPFEAELNSTVPRYSPESVISNVSLKILECLYPLYFDSATAHMNIDDSVASDMLIKRRIEHAATETEYFSGHGTARHLMQRS